MKKNIGPIEQKILLSLLAGAAIALNRRPGRYWKIINTTIKEWKKINRRSLRDAVRRLYESKLVSYKEKSDGAISLILNEEGKIRALEYSLNTMIIKKPKYWDRLWRIIIFDIPENKKRGRNALAATLKQLGCYPLQKSVFIYPYECKDEIDFITEIFLIRPYIRYIVACDIDNALHLKNIFHLN